MSDWLTVSILPSGVPVLEREPLAGEESKGRKQFEDMLVSAHAGPENKAGFWLLLLGLSNQGMQLSPSLSFWRSFSAAWIHEVRVTPDADEKRGALKPELADDDLEAFFGRLPPMTGLEYITRPVLRGIWNHVTQAFSYGIAGFKGTVEEYFRRLAPSDAHIDRIHFHLVENKRSPAHPFAFMATYTTRIDEEGRSRHLPLKHALAEFNSRKEKLLELLATVNKVAKTNGVVRKMLDSGELFHPVSMTPVDAFELLKGVPEFETAGILCRIPRWWKGGARRASLSLSVGSSDPGILGKDSLLDFAPSLSVDGQTVTEAEARQILEKSDGLVMLRGQWVAVDTASLETALSAMQRAREISESEQISFHDAMKLLMGGEPDRALGLPGGIVEVTCGEWLKTVFEKLANPELMRSVEPSPGLRAELREYQKAGLNWLQFIHTLGFGACLADDMGLGKTVQMLAHLQLLKGGGKANLIVAPASLLHNWQMEVEKFTPDMKTVIAHPQAMKGGELDALAGKVDEYDLVITTYGMLFRCGWIMKHSWNYVVCDEAQAIKNAGSRQARAVKELKAAGRCVMTGTPVENRLSDLWSLFDFINPGLLGSFNEFKKFSRDIASIPEGYGRLRRVVQPYILRRSKSDKTIIKDLPDKVELKAYCGLSKTQAVLYSNLVRKLDEDLKASDGIKRKGIVLAYLMKFKQLCNHPDHFNGSGAFVPEESGKFLRLMELCQTIHEKRERALIFTQFREITPALSSFLAGKFGATVLTLHGGTAVKERKGLVERFQSEEYIPFFVLSLKAGGVGLNLTEANHVVHFDRWWNPAVENQATDRAFRIGQKKNVMVHKFISRGTVEEKIDELIEGKKSLAEQVVPGSAENWITELSDRQLHEMFKLTLADAAEE